MMKPEIFLELLKILDSKKNRVINNYNKELTNISVKSDLVNKFHLVSRARGVYVPKNTPMALSIKIDPTKDDYNDLIEFDNNGVFNKILYHGPNKSKDNSQKKDNSALKYNADNKIPIGIIYGGQNYKPNKYQCLGLGIIENYTDDNIYTVVPFTFEDNIEKYINSLDEFDNKIITETTKEINVRLKQMNFRNKILKQNKCFLCDITQQEILIASHIKPWSHSNNYEKLDECNGLLLCPIHDKLFDKGFISFENGKLKISRKLNTPEIYNLDDKYLYHFNIQQIPYINYHLKYIFQK